MCTTPRRTGSFSFNPRLHMRLNHLGFLLKSRFQLKLPWRWKIYRKFMRHYAGKKLVYDRQLYLIVTQSCEISTWLSYIGSFKFMFLRTSVDRIFCFSDHTLMFKLFERLVFVNNYDSGCANLPLFWKKSQTRHKIWLWNFTFRLHFHLESSMIQKISPYLTWRFKLSRLGVPYWLIPEARTVVIPNPPWLL